MDLPALSFNLTLNETTERVFSVGLDLNQIIQNDRQSIEKQDKQDRREQNQVVTKKTTFEVDLTNTNEHKATVHSSKGNTIEKKDRKCFFCC